VWNLGDDCVSALDNVKLHLIDSVDEAGKLMTWLGERRPDEIIGIDIESTGLDKFKDTIRLVQIGDQETGWAIPWEDWGGVVREVVRKYDGWYVGHNFINFDWTFLDRAGVRVPRHRLHDTRPLAHILDPTYSTALKNLASKHVDSRAAGMQQSLDEAIGAKGGWTWATVPIDFPQYWQYGALDPVISLRLWDFLKAKIDADGSWKAYEVEIGVAWVTRQMEINGAHVDRAYASQYQDKYARYCDEVAQWVKSTYNVSPGSNQAIIDVLRAEGFDFVKRTKSGADALDADVLASIDHPLASAVLSRRKLQKVGSTYLSHIVSDADADDLMHPSINPLGARTSRMSMSGPNLQNLPRASESNPAATTVRNCYTTRYGDAGRMVFTDFSQIEMRGLAHMSQDAGMKAAFLKTDEDFFVNLARDVFRDDTITKKDPRRQVVKNVGYGKIYGAGIAKLALTARISEEQAAAAMHAFDASFPGVRAFQNRVQRVALERKAAEGVGYVRSPLTNRRHPSDPGKEYALVNYLVQGLAAEIFKMKLVELDNAGLGQYMILPVHDEVIMDVPNDDLHEVVRTVQSVMNDHMLLSIPIEAETSVGKRWGEKEAYAQVSGS
jgi:DNA polymerase-1